MLSLLIALVAVLLLGLAVLVGLRQAQAETLRSRLDFGGFVVAETGASVEDLTRDDYGLAGRALVEYRVTQWINSTSGRLGLAVLGGLIGYGISRLTGRTLNASIGVVLASAVASVGLSYLSLTRRRQRRERAIRKALPDVLEMLAAIMEGGTAFDAALQHIVREADLSHPLYLELSITLEAMRRGRRRHEALRLLAARVNLPQVAEIVAGLTQADQTGSSTADVLRHHAKMLFREYEAEVQRRAERLPIKMMFPMMFTIMPAMLIVTGFPSFLRLYRVLESIFAGRA